MALTTKGTGGYVMQRPQTIVWWEILFWVAIVLGIVNLLVFTPSMSTMMEQAQMEQPAATAPATDAPSGAGIAETKESPAAEMAMAAKVIGTMEIVVAVVYVLLGLVFWYFIARRGSHIFKWIWVVLAVLGILGSLANLGATFAFSAIGGIIGLVVMVIGVVNVVLIFLPASRPWFSGGARTQGEV